MSEDKTDRPATPPELVDPPERATDAAPITEQQPVSDHHNTEHSADEVQPEASAEPTQAEIAAEQAEASLDARDDASAHPAPAGYSAPAESTAAYPASADSSAAAHPSPAIVAPVAAPTAAERTVPEYDYPATQQAPVQQRAFTPPPAAPKKKGNRGIGALIAILSVIVFLVIFAAVAAIVIAVGTPGSGTLMGFLASPVFYVPAIFFVIGFVLVVLLANRANWWAYILGSLFVAALVYFGTIAVGLVVNNILLMTQAEAAAAFAQSASNPYIIAAALVAREVSMWIGAAISARGRRMKARNLTAREEYERAAAEHRAEYERGFAPA